MICNAVSDIMQKNCPIHVFLGTTMVVMGSQKDKKKKFKGKKKVKNLMEKKAKGLKLNQVDRKRLVKVFICSFIFTAQLFLMKQVWNKGTSYLAHACLRRRHDSSTI